MAQSTEQLKQPQIILDDQGRQVAAWVEFKGGEPCLSMAHRCAESSWSSPKILPDSQDCQAFKIVRAGQGGVVIVWWDKLIVYGAEFSFETGEWKSTQLTSSEQIVMQFPEYAFNSRGEGVMAWVAFDEQDEGFYIQVAELKLD